MLKDTGLALAEDKTDAVLITKRIRKPVLVSGLAKHVITSKPANKYLGVMIDTRLKFNIICNKGVQC